MIRVGVRQQDPTNWAATKPFGLLSDGGHHLWCDHGVDHHGRPVADDDRSVGEDAFTDHGRQRHRDAVGDAVEADVLVGLALMGFHDAA